MMVLLWFGRACMCMSGLISCTPQTAHMAMYGVWSRSRETTRVSTIYIQTFMKPQQQQQQTTNKKNKQSQRKPSHTNSRCATLMRSASASDWFWSCSESFCRWLRRRCNLMRMRLALATSRSNVEMLASCPPSSSFSSACNANDEQTKQRRSVKIEHWV